VLVILAGAGASKAVAPESYPTTIEFFENLPDSVKKDKFFDLIVQYLRVGGPRETKAIDIEQVLWALSELKDFLNLAGSSRSVPGWFLQASRLTAPLSQKTDFSNLTKHTAQLCRLLDELVGQINRQVYEWYSRLPEDEALEMTWAPVLRQLLEGEDRLEIFTTNYDLVLEATAQHLSNDRNLPEIAIGHTSGLQRRLDLDLWRQIQKGEGAKRGPGALVTKLHGSVDWSRQKDEIFISDPYYKGTETRHVILYPGFKGVPDQQPFALFHSHFESAVSSAQGILFVGFAFRDEYLNQVLARATPPRTRIVVVNPSEALPSMPFSGKRVSHIRQPFTAEVGLEAVKRLRKS